MPLSPIGGRGRGGGGLARLRLEFPQEIQGIEKFLPCGHTRALLRRHIRSRRRPYQSTQLHRREFHRLARVALLKAHGEFKDNEKKKIYRN